MKTDTKEYETEAATKKDRNGIPREAWRRRTDTKEDKNKQTKKQTDTRNRHKGKNPERR